MEELEQLNYLKYQIENVQKSYDDIIIKLCQLEELNINLENSLDNITQHRQYYKSAIDLVYQRSIKELTDLLNSALEYIFEDRRFNIEIELSNKRGKSLNFIMLHNGKKVSLKTGTGMGVKCVISAILQIYYLQCKNSKILMLDETYSAIADEYISRFFEFLNQLCQRLQFKIIIITHDRRFIDYATKCYKVLGEGKIQLWNGPTNKERLN